MARLSWGNAGERFYEAGTDRGVLYLDGVAGVPWNGLVSVSESPNGGEARPYYLDGYKYANLSAAEEFEATIEAFNSPAEFAACDGTRSLANGLFITQQPRKPFGMTYRTKIGNDTEGLEHGYKIHILYNALAGPSEKEHTTISDELEAMTYSWDISTAPPKVSGYRPTSHFVVDSRTSDPVALGYLEGVLYGTDGLSARLPSPVELISIFSWQASGITTPVTLLGIASNDVQETFTNMAINPSFETPEGTVEVRRNRVPNPSAESGSITGWTPANINLVAHPVHHTAPEGGRFFRATISEVIDGHLNQRVDLEPWIDVVGGRTYTISTYLRTNTYTVEAAMVIYFRDSSGAVVGSHSVDTVSGSEFTKIHLTVTAPDTATTVMPRIGFPSTPTRAVGDFFDYDGVMIEETGTLEPYFDGDTIADNDFTYSWTGVPYASPSVQSAKAIAGASHAIAYQRSDYAASGSKSVVIVSDGTSQDSYLQLPGLETGTSYTLLGIVNTPVAQIGQIHNRARAITVFHKTADGPYIEVKSNQGPIEGSGETRLILNVPSDAVSAFARLYNGSPTEGDIVYWDNLVIVDKEYDGPYFDGDASGVYQNQKMLTQWEGTPHASRSVATLYTALTTPGRVGDAYLIDDSIWVFTQDGYWDRKAVIPQP